MLTKDKDCDDIREIYEVLNDFSQAAQPGAYIADTFPPLDKLPKALQWWRPSAEAAFERQKKTWMRYWNRLQVLLAENRAPECFVKQLVETTLEKQGISEVEAGFAAGCKSGLKTRPLFLCSSDGANICCKP